MPYPLPAGYQSDPSVGFVLLVQSMERHGLTPIAVQNHGQQIVDALNQDYPDLHVYLSPTDSPVWPGFGSLDVTVDSGKGGWEFRPDGYFPYDPSQYVPPTAPPAPPVVIDAPPAPPPLDPPRVDLWAIESQVAALLRQFDTLADDLAAIEELTATRHAELLARLDALQQTMPATQPDYTGTVKLPWLKVVTFTLTPVPVP